MTPTPLGLVSLSEYFDGRLSASRVCKHMAHPVAGGSVDNIEVRISSSTDSSKQDCSRCINRILDELPLLKTTYYVPQISWTHVMFPPNDISIYQDHFPDHFRTKRGADETKVASFWDEFICSLVKKSLGRRVADAEAQNSVGAASPYPYGGS